MGFHSLLLPPPNLTGELHLGHFWNIVLQDFRFKWEEARKSLNYWAIGLDHAGLSFQCKFDSLFDGDISKAEEERYLSAMEEYASSIKTKILTQFSGISSSIPVDRYRYTLEPEIQKSVVEIFKTLFAQGLIYRKKRLVNWDIKLGEVLSDFEIEYRKEDIKLYFIRYYFEEAQDAGDKYIVVATTRPETIFGDAALFVNTIDERYRSKWGKKVYIPGVDRVIPIIPDPSVKIEFGTGVVKCTPAHDLLDWSLMERHSLSYIQIISEDGKLNENGGLFSGMDRLEAREKILDWLKDGGYIEKIEGYTTLLPFSSRTGTQVERIPSEQWFLSSSIISKKASEVILSGRHKLNIYPAEEVDRLIYSLENMEDWCLSRQILWGIKVPIFYDIELQKYTLEDIGAGKCIREEITLDTWFSSSLWPIIVFEGLEGEKKKFFPFTTLISGKDILRPWISRMIFLSIHLIGKLPFKNIFLHGLLRTKSGAKMSKSLENGVKPEELLSRYSGDIVRFAFLYSTHFVRDIKYSEEIFTKSRLFIHKLENALLFFRKKMKIYPDITLDPTPSFERSELSWIESWILRESSFFSERIERYYSEFNYSALTREIMDFYLDNFCNRYIELLKLECTFSLNRLYFASYLWELSARILYPFLPLFSSKIMKELFNSSIQPRYISSFYPPKVYKKDEATDEWFFKYIDEVRRLYHAIGVKPSWNSDLRIVSLKRAEEFASSISLFTQYLGGFNQTFRGVGREQKADHYPTLKVGSIYFELSFDSSIFPRRKYISFLESQLHKYEIEREREARILSRDVFISSAPPELLKRERRKYRYYLEMYEFYRAQLNAVSKEDLN